MAATAILLFIPLMCSAAITFKQVNSTVLTSNSTTVATAFSSAQTAGDLNVVVVAWRDSTVTVSSVQDSKGNTYAIATGPKVSSGHATQSIYYATNIASATAGANTVTVTFSASATKPELRVAEYSGLLATTPLDVATGAVGTSGTAANSGSVTTTYANDLIVGADASGSTTSAVGSGFTQRVNTSTNGDVLEDKTVTSAGSNSATATLSASSWWIMQMAAFKATDTTVPSTPTGLTGTVASATQINLSWTASTDNIGVTGYRVERCAGASCSNYAQVATPTTTSYNDTGLSPSTSYSYRVRAADAAGNLSAYSSVVTKVTSADTTAPSAPTGLSATAASSTQINLSWTASTDNVGVTGYRVERCSGASCSTFAQIGTPTATTYNDTGLTAGTSYSYRVRAVDAANNLGAYSSTATATTQSSDTQAPTAPSSLVATATVANQISLSWGAATDNVGITAYRVERCAGQSCSNFTQIAAQGAVTTYTDTGLTPSSSFSYRVRAGDAAGNLGGYSPVAGAVTLPGTASGTVTYGYDALGRLVQAGVASIGLVENYAYDAAGNIAGVSTTSITVPSISTVSTFQAAAGSQVIIYGSGFSSTPSQNSVTFNGVTATVVSATSTQLVVTVPSGFSAGAVAVTVAGQTVTAGNNFTATATQAPTITSFAPGFVNPGSLLTIFGTNFSSTPADNRVLIGSTWVSATSASSTTLTMTVPQGAGTGFVTVTTPNGSVTSSTMLLVVPAGYGTAAPIASLALTTDGTPATLTAPSGTQPNTTAYATFTGQIAQRLTLTTATNTYSNLYAWILAPDGTLLTSGGLSTTMGLQLPALTQAGTYLISFVIPGQGTASVAMSPPVPYSLTLGGAAVAVNLNPSGSRAALSFTGSAGSFVNLALTSSTISNGTAMLYAPDGSVVTSIHITNFGSLSLQPKLPASGTYVLLVEPVGNLTGGITASLSSLATPTLVPNNSTSVNLPAYSPVTLTFTGTVGQTMEIGVANNNINGYVSVQLTAPDGSAVAITGGGFSASYTVYPGPSTVVTGGTTVNIDPLPQSGLYTLTLTNSGSAGSVTAALTSPAQTVPQALNTTVTLPGVSVLGQGMQYTFDAIAGQYVAVGITLDSSMYGAQVTIYGPDGRKVVDSTFQKPPAGSLDLGSTTLNLAPAPASGTYTVLVQQSYHGATTGTWTSAISTPVLGALSGTAESVVTSTIAGQGALLTMTGTQGQSGSILVIENAADGNGQSQIHAATVVLADPHGKTVATAPMPGTQTCIHWSGDQTGTICLQYAWGGSAEADFRSLPSSGNYTVAILQATAGTGSLHVSYVPAISSALTPNTPVTDTLGGGQEIVHSFVGSAGQYLTFGIGGIAYLANGVAGNGTITVIAPDGSIVTSQLISAGQSNFSVQIGPLPVSGTYQIVVSSSNSVASAGSVQVALTTSAGGALTPNTPASQTTTAIAQTISETFSATAGDIYALVVSGNGSPNTGVTVNVLDPNGTTIANTNATNGACTSPCTWNAILGIGPLPQTGTYTVSVPQYAPSSTNIGETFTLKSATTGTVTLGGSALSLPITSDTVAAASLSGTAGQLLLVQVTSGLTGRASVVSPAGTILANAFIGIAGGSATFAAGPMPTTGTYKITFVPNSASGSGTFVVSASSPSATSGSTTAVSTSAAGQTATFSFAAGAGQSVSVALTGITTNPVNSVSYFAAAVLNPDASAYRTDYCYTVTSGSCEFHFQNLPQSGTYTVNITGLTGATVSMTAAVIPDAVGRLVQGTPQSVTLSTAGKSGWYSLSLVAGQPSVLAISSVATTPAAVPLTISVVPVTNGSATSLSTTNSAVIDLSSLPPGEYQVYVVPQSPATSSFQLSLTPSLLSGIALTTNGSGSTYTTTGLGAAVRLSFSGTTGQQLMLGLTNIAVTPSNGSTYVYVTAYAPDNSSIASANCAASGSCELPLPTLTQSGTYRIVAAPIAAGVLSLTATLSQNATGTLALGTPLTVNLPATGEAVTLGFTVTAHQTVALYLGALTLSPAGTPVQLYVYDASHSTIYYNNSVTGPLAINLANLAAGNYQVVITPASPVTGSVQVTLQAGAVGTLTPVVSGTGPVFSTTSPGGNGYIYFQGNAGQSLTLALTGLTITPSGQNSVSVYITAPDGSSVVSQTCYTTPDCEIVLTRLPKTGRYTATITPYGLVTLSFSATLAQQATGTLQTGQTQSVNLSAMGEAALYVLPLGTTQSVALSIAGLPAAAQTTNVAIRTSSGSLLTGAAPTVNVAAGVAYNLDALAPDTYQVAVWPTVPVTGVTQISVQPKLVSALTPVSSGTGAVVSTLIPGQNAYLTFSGTSGLSYSFALGSLTVSPANATSNIQVLVINPDGSSGATTTCFTSSTSCEVPLPKVPQSGTYTLKVTPNGFGTLSFSATLSADVTATLVSGSAAPVSLNAFGQGAMLTFSAPGGTAATIDVASLVATPSGSTFQWTLYNSAGSVLTYSSFTANGSIGLGTLTAGTYSFLVEPQLPATATMSLTYH